ncbi:Hypothetical predicted protein [Octopus vulgaris]|uniref:Uncharacterized protein n=1 Tax=Octopus vulgaris TaxID=6645 RepID=A0AA36BIQ2_OCTVU|nr:Hypothetical predicted protein [Octopus vulgaris]
MDICGFSHLYPVTGEILLYYSIRFPKIFPLINEEYVAMKTVEATLTNTLSLIIPQHLTVIFWIKTIIPVEVTNLVNDFFGITSAMQTYKGNEKQCASKDGQEKKKTKC